MELPSSVGLPGELRSPPSLTHLDDLEVYNGQIEVGKHWTLAG